ncbi:hypothetical protein ACOME3_001060 [Neoechinorhynchus agilis]
MVRKRAEHNDCVLHTLEEISLHHLGIERWCPDLKILLLQGNVIRRIENMSRLKHLQYLNLALNCIQTIENLEECEALEKLDLTLNFIADLKSVSKLRANENLRELHLIGNPCCDYDQYRMYVIKVLSPKLNVLDGVRINAYERRAAMMFNEQTFSSIGTIIEVEDSQIDRFLRILHTEGPSAKLPHCPAARIASQKFKELNSIQEPICVPVETQSKVKYMKPDGTPRCCNEAKSKFRFIDETGYYILKLFVPRYLSSDLVSCVAHPNYVRVTVKGKVFQITLLEEIHADKTTFSRNKDELTVKMFKVNDRHTFNVPKKQMKNKTMEHNEDDLSLPPLVE